MVSEQEYQDDETKNKILIHVVDLTGPDAIEYKEELNEMPHPKGRTPPMMMPGMGLGVD